MSIKIKITREDEIQPVSEQELWGYYQELERNIPLSCCVVYFYTLWIVDPERYKRTVQAVNSEV